MRLRAGNEVRMTITSGFPFPEFAQRLVGDAFKAAALGTLESDWIGGVLSGPHAPVEAWMRDAYERSIAFLRKQKTMAVGARGRSEWVGHLLFLWPLPRLAY